MATARLIALGTALLAAAPVAAAASRAGPGGPALTVSFKVDPRVTKSLYMGERWASPARYSRVQDGKKLVVEARAHGRDARGNPVPVRAAWAVADPAIVTLSAREGHEVTLRVRRVGRTALTVTHGRGAQTLAVEVVEQRGLLHVSISRAEVAGRSFADGERGLRGALQASPEVTGAGRWR